jgi:small subunit ribosomal protein S3
MGQKVNPIGLRTGVNKDWSSKWYASKKDFATFLNRDVEIRRFLSKKLKDAAVSNVVIERTAKRTEVIIYTAKPGVIIGHGGEEIETLKKELSKITSENVQISIMEIKNPDLSAQIVADNIARQIENRASFRVAQKRAIRNTMKAGAKGIKTKVSGRLGGADIARSEGYSEGTTPLHTIRADIDYATSEADTTFGKIGVKVWIYKGEILKQKKKDAKEAKGGKDNGTNTKKN